MTSGRRPDYRVTTSKRVERGEKAHYAEVGAGWLLEKGGGISVRLHPGISIASGDDWRITLWPTDDRKSDQDSGDTEF